MDILPIDNKNKEKFVILKSIGVIAINSRWIHLIPNSSRMN